MLPRLVDRDAPCAAAASNAGRYARVTGGDFGHRSTSRMESAARSQAAHFQISLALLVKLKYTKKNIT